MITCSLDFVQTMKNKFFTIVQNFTRINEIFYTACHTRNIVKLVTLVPLLRFHWNIKFLFLFNLICPLEFKDLSLRYYNFLYNWQSTICDSLVPTLGLQVVSRGYRSYICHGGTRFKHYSWLSSWVDFVNLYNLHSCCLEIIACGVRRIGNHCWSHKLHRMQSSPIK